MSHRPRRRDLIHEMGHVGASVYYQRPWRNTTAVALASGVAACALTFCLPVALFAATGGTAGPAAVSVEPV